MAKKTNVTPMTGMYEALKAAHNSGRSKAINAEFANGAGAHVTVFDAWVWQVEHDLYNVVIEYVKAKIAKRTDATITSKDLEKLRKAIMPVWRNIALAGQDFAGNAKIHISVHDIEDLVGFAWKYSYCEAGVAEVAMGKTQFRRLIETKIGCMMAKAAWMTEKDEAVKKEYDKAVSVVETGEKRLEELKKAKESYEREYINKPEASADLKKFVMDNFITPIKNEDKDLRVKIREAQVTIENRANQVQAIEDKCYKQIP